MRAKSVLPAIAALFGCARQEITLPSADVELVSREIRRIAAEEIMPRFGMLAQEDIRVKADRSLVTDADLETEKKLAAFLTKLLPGSLMIGEEAASANPQQLKDLGQNRTKPVWVVDPVDGTANFSKGDPHFGVMVALVSGGVAQQAWLYYPALGDMLVAERGRGLRLNGKRYRIPRALPLKRLSLALVRPERQAALAHVSAGLAPLVKDLYRHSSTSAEALSLIKTGGNGFVHCNPTVWDHLPSSLAIREAGGVAEKFNGAPPDLALSSQDALIFLPSRRSARQLRKALGIPARHRARAPS